jgi:serine/threonine protein kinase
MSINDLIHIGSGSFGIVMKTSIDNNPCVVKQFRVQLLEDESNSFDNEVYLTKKAYNINNDIFIKILKSEMKMHNLAKMLNINVPCINSICYNEFGYIYMEYMEQGDLYKFLKEYNNYDFDITGILGCYLNGLYIIHNELKIIHGDLTPMNILVQYVGPNYKQKICYNGIEYNINTCGYNFKIADFGLADYINDTRYSRNNNAIYINYIYRDYLLLFYLYFYNNYFINYNIFRNIIEITIENIKNDLYDSYGLTEEYNKYFIDKYNFNNVCHFMDTYLEIKHDCSLLYETPRILLIEFLEVVNNII